MLSVEAEKKAKEILKQHKELKIKQNKALINRLIAITLINETCLPYRVLMDLLQNKESKEILPNRFYPNPSESLIAAALKPTIEDMLYEEKMTRYKEQLQREEWQSQKWRYYFARFLIGYDVEKFTLFDFIGNNSNDSNINIEEWKRLLIETQKEVTEKPNEFYLEPNERKEEHQKKYNVPIGYMKGM